MKHQGSGIPTGPEPAFRRPLKFRPVGARDPAIVDRDDAVGELQRAVIMCNGEDRAPRVLRNLGQQLHHRHAVLGIERRRRLVRQNDGGRAGKRTGNRDALLLAARHLRRHGVDAMAKAHCFERVGGVVVGVGSAQVA